MRLVSCEALTSASNYFLPLVTRCGDILLCAGVMFQGKSEAHPPSGKVCHPSNCRDDPASARDSSRRAHLFLCGAQVFQRGSSAKLRTSNMFCRARMRFESCRLHDKLGRRAQRLWTLRRLTLLHTDTTAKVLALMCLRPPSGAPRQRTAFFVLVASQDGQSTKLACHRRRPTACTLPPGSVHFGLTSLDGSHQTHGTDVLYFKHTFLLFTKSVALGFPRLRGRRAAVQCGRWPWNASCTTVTGSDLDGCHGELMLH